MEELLKERQPMARSHLPKESNLNRAVHFPQGKFTQETQQTILTFLLKPTISLEFLKNLSTPRHLIRRRPSRVRRL